MPSRATRRALGIADFWENELVNGRGWRPALALFALAPLARALLCAAIFTYRIAERIAPCRDFGGD